MVFSNSLSDYFDPPNWPQQGNQQQSGIIPTTDHPLQILASPPAPLSGSGGSGGSGSIRPGSMLDRARLARVPLPEPGLKCPRCDSSNTKFCYFNNYNLSQPRHFCKTCRRYWTRGGALRNVPVGGGYRRNKRSKGRTKSASAQPAQRNSGGGGSSNSTPIPSSVNTSTNGNRNGNSNGFSSQMLLPPPPPYMPGLHHLNEYMGGFGINLGGGGAVEFEMGGSSSSGVSRVHQLSNLLNGSGVTGNGLYPTFHQESNTSTANELDHASGFGSQISRVKGEDSHGLNLSNNFMMGIDQPNGDDDDDDEYHNWGSGNGWTDISGFQAPSSAGNLL